VQSFRAVSISRQRHRAFLGSADANMFWRNDFFPDNEDFSEFHRGLSLSNPAFRINSSVASRNISRAQDSGQRGN
jgi:hypothetical protein